MIVSCGEALVDLVPEAAPGGGPMNVAIAAARLGAPAAFVGRVSTDHHGQAIWDHLVSNGVDVTACERGDEPTARAIVEHVPHLQFRFEGDDTADTKLSSADLALLGHGQHIVHGGALGLFRGRTAETLAGMVERHNGVVSLDPNVRPQMITDRSEWDHFHQRWMRRAHVYRGSDEDFDWIWPGRSPDACAEELLAQGCAVVMFTRGADGVVVFTANNRIEVAGKPIDVVDTVGAGDTFVAAVLVGLFERGLDEPTSLIDVPAEEWSDVASFAVAASAVTCSRPGADPPTRAELEGRARSLG